MVFNQFFSPSITLHLFLLTLHMEKDLVLLCEAVATWVPLPLLGPPLLRAHHSSPRPGTLVRASTGQPSPYGLQETGE